MTVTDLKTAVLALDSAAQQEFILTLLPELGPSLVKDPAFLPKLLPVMLALVKQSGVDLGQLLQMASMFAPSAAPSRD